MLEKPTQLIQHKKAKNVISNLALGSNNILSSFENVFSLNFHQPKWIILIDWTFFLSLFLSFSR